MTAGAFVRNGRLAPGGQIPVNTSGGLLSGYHLGELTHMAEAIQQLRGEAATRQVADAKICNQICQREPYVI